MLKHERIAILEDLAVRQMGSASLVAGAQFVSNCGT
jgi:hypothetical protein